MMIRDKLMRFAVFFPAILFAGVYFFYFNKEDITVFPVQKTALTTYSDVQMGGASSVDSITVSDAAIKFYYTLNDKHAFPFAGFVFNSLQKDISSYNRLHLEASGKNIHKFNVFLLTKESAVKDSTHNLALRHSFGEIILSPERKNFECSFKKFSTPDWWYSAFNFIRSEFPEPDWKRYKGISFSSGANPVLNKESLITVYSIKFYRDNTWVFITYAFIHICLLLVCAGWMFIKSKKAASAVITINYKALSIEEKKESTHTFLEYIHQNFDDSELTLSKVSDKTGVPQKIISETISDAFHSNFKTYINQIRIQEAQRLLKESKLNSSEIAYKVGFNSPSNFNRVFKSLTGKSPSEFLETIEK